MKNIFLLSLLCVALAGAQTKKTANKAAKGTLAKTDVAAVEWREKGKETHIYYLAGKDTVMLKTNEGKLPEVLPGCSIKPFTAQGTPLCLVSWQEKTVQGDAKSKLENITTTHYRVIDPAQKTVLHENYYAVANITEIVWLDPNKTASKTVEKVRREGFELSLTPQGDLLLANKTQQDKMGYDAATKKYVALPTAAKQPAKKKR